VRISSGSSPQARQLISLKCKLHILTFYIYIGCAEELDFIVQYALVIFKYHASNNWKKKNLKNIIKQT
jgi:hypothetical protein